MISRRQFLKARFTEAQNPLRPPWHLAEAEFTRLCTRCGDCIEACPSRLLSFGQGGFPEISFQNDECTFCGDCATRCAAGALRFAPELSPWAFKAVISSDCLSFGKVVCRSCAEACDARAIRLAPALGGIPTPLVDHQACTGCGACVGVCPSRAVSVTNPEFAATNLARKFA